jgi:hypothetical protein
MHGTVYWNKIIKLKNLVILFGGVACKPHLKDHFYVTGCAAGADDDSAVWDCQDSKNEFLSAKCGINLLLKFCGCHWCPCECIFKHKSCGSRVNPFANIFVTVGCLETSRSHIDGVRVCNCNHETVYSVHSPTKALFIKLEKALKFTLKFTLSSLLHVSVYDHHQGAYAGACLKLYLC